jgi:1-acyl-sn-glycerol-3-phosphate acyltransferase
VRRLPRRHAALLARRNAQQPRATANSQKKGRYEVSYFPFFVFLYHPSVFVAAVRSILAYVLVSLYVLIVSLFGIPFAFLTGYVEHLHWLGHGGVRLACWLTGIKYRIVGTPPHDRAVVFCSNHESNVDPPVLFHVLHPAVRVLYKRELDAIPVLARTFRMGGFIPVDRGNRDAAMRSIETGANSLRAGKSFLIFPEGTRSKTSDLLPFKKGGFVMAIQAQAPIVPVAVQGGRAAMRRGSWIIRPVTVSIRVGEPIETAGYTIEDRHTLIARVRAAIEAMLAQGPIAA